MYFTKDLYFTLWFIDKLNRYLKMVVNTVCAEVGARDNFRDNGVAKPKNCCCHVVANCSKIVALSLSRRKIVANFRDIRLTN